MSSKTDSLLGLQGVSRSIDFPRILQFKKEAGAACCKMDSASGGFLDHTDCPSVHLVILTELSLCPGH